MSRQRLTEKESCETGREKNMEEEDEGAGK